jgi:hypothetical protein
VLYHEVSSLPESTSPHGNGNGNGSYTNGANGSNGHFPSSSPPVSAAQWYTTDTGAMLYQALLSLCRTEIGATTPTTSAGNA